MGFRDEMHETPAEASIRDARQRESAKLKKDELIKRLEPYAQCCLSGSVAEWPQLNPLLRDIFNYLKDGS